MFLTENIHHLPKRFLFSACKGNAVAACRKKRSISSLEEQNEDQIQEQYEICVKPYRIGRTLILGWKRDRALLLQGLPGKKPFCTLALCMETCKEEKTDLAVFGSSQPGR